VTPRMAALERVAEAARALLNAIDGIMAGNIMGVEGLIPRLREALRAVLTEKETKP
jgi:hypothetical protein